MSTPDHVEFAEFQDCETHMRRLADEVLQLAQLNTDHHSVECPQVQAVWLAHQLGDVRVIGEQPHIISLQLIFAWLPVEGGVHQLVEV